MSTEEFIYHLVRRAYEMDQATGGEHARDAAIYMLLNDLQEDNLTGRI